MVQVGNVNKILRCAICDKKLTHRDSCSAVSQESVIYHLDVLEYRHRFGIHSVVALDKVGRIIM